MEKNTNSSNNEEFDIIDFDLNEYDEEFKKEEEKRRRKEERKASAAKSGKEQAQNTRPDSFRNKPNRDMLKTILMILFVIVIACLFLGLITFIVNNAGGVSKPKKTAADKTTERSNRNSESNTDSSPSTQSKDDAKQNLEDNIDKITNKVKEDKTTEDSKTTKDKTTEDSKKTAATTEDIPETTTEDLTEPVTEDIPELPAEPASTEADTGSAPEQ